MTHIKIETEMMDVSIKLSSLSPETVARAIASLVSDLLTQDSATIATPKAQWNVVLIECGERKIEVIKVIRNLTGLGLKEAKDAAESVRKIVLTVDSPMDAAQAVRLLRSAGALAEIEQAE